MLPLEKIREDLKEIRYYYSKQKFFDDASKSVIQNTILEKVGRYNQAMKDAPVQLYDLYISLYVQNNTQSALAYEWDFTEVYMSNLNSKLCKYLQNTLSEIKSI